MPTPVPPPLLVPEGFELPVPALELPYTQEFQWINPPVQAQQEPPQLSVPEPNRSTELTPPASEEDSAAPSTAKTEPPAADPIQQSLPAPAEQRPVVPQPAVTPEFSEVRQITVPIINKEIPVPTTEILVTATATAGISSVTAVAGTLMANSLFKQLLRVLKPVTKVLLKKLAKLRKKPEPLSWARARRLERRLGRSR